MASRKVEELRDSLNSLKKLVECPICHSMLKDPIEIATCGHIFCESCVSGVIRKKAKAQCPICRTIFTKRSIIPAPNEVNVKVVTDVLNAFNKDLTAIHKQDQVIFGSQLDVGSSPIKPVLPTQNIKPPAVLPIQTNTSRLTNNSLAVAAFTPTEASKDPFKFVSSQEPSTSKETSRESESVLPTTSKRAKETEKKEKPGEKEEVKKKSRKRKMSWSRTPRSQRRKKRPRLSDGNEDFEKGASSEVAVAQESKAEQDRNKEMEEVAVIDIAAAENYQLTVEVEKEPVKDRSEDPSEDSVMTEGPENEEGSRGEKEEAGKVTDSDRPKEALISGRIPPMEEAPVRESSTDDPPVEDAEVEVESPEETVITEQNPPTDPASPDTEFYDGNAVNGYISLEREGSQETLFVEQSPPRAQDLGGEFSGDTTSMKLRWRIEDSIESGHTLMEAFQIHMSWLPDLVRAASEIDEGSAADFLEWLGYRAMSNPSFFNPDNVDFQETQGFSYENSEYQDTPDYNFVAPQNVIKVNIGMESPSDHSGKETAEDPSKETSKEQEEETVGELLRARAESDDAVLRREEVICEGTEQSVPKLDHQTTDELLMEAAAKVDQGIGSVEDLPSNSDRTGDQGVFGDVRGSSGATEKEPAIVHPLKTEVTKVDQGIIIGELAGNSGAAERQPESRIHPLERTWNQDNTEFTKLGQGVDGDLSGSRGAFEKEQSRFHPFRGASRDGRELIAEPVVPASVAMAAKENQMSQDSDISTMEAVRELERTGVISGGLPADRREQELDDSCEDLFSQNSADAENELVTETQMERLFTEEEDGKVLAEERQEREIGPPSSQSQSGNEEEEEGKVLAEESQEREIRPPQSGNEEEEVPDSAETDEQLMIAAADEAVQQAQKNQPRRPIKYCCTGFARQDYVQMEKRGIWKDFAVLFGAERVKTVEECTHLVVFTGKQETGVYLADRTMKYFQAVALGKMLVSHEWVIDCQKNKQLKQEEAYEIIGDTVTGRSDGPRNSRMRTGMPLLDRHCFFLGGSFQSCNKESFELLILSCGGMLVDSIEKLEEAKKDKKLKCILLVDQNEDNEDYWKEMWEQKKPVIFRVDWILDSVSRQEITAYTPYRLPRVEGYSQ